MQLSDTTDGRARAPRWGALGVGLGLSAFIAVATPYNEMIVNGSRLGLSSLTPAAFFLFFVWVVLVNPLLRAVRPAWALRRMELLLVFSMMMVATAVPTRGVTGVMLSMISGSYYYASSENQWADLVLPHVKPWMTVRGVDGLRHFYEGVPKGVSPDWAVWVQPLAAWFLMIVALWVAVLCLMVMLRRQWVERERLAFPVMQVPLAMVEGSEGRFWAPFFLNRLVWIGFAIPFLLGSLDAIHHYFPTFPALVASTPRLVTLRGTVNLTVRLNPLMFGFAYLVNTRLSLSLWVFYLIRVFAEGGFNILGVYNPEQLGTWTNSGQVGPIFAHQSMGAMFVFVGFSLWASRQHLREVLHRARRPNAGDGADGEMISYRRAMMGFALGAAVMAGWLWRSGVPLWIAPVVVVVAFVIFVSLTRAIVDGGLATIVPAMIPLGFTLSAFGTDALGVAGVVAMGFTLVWAGDLLTFMMAPTAHAVRVASDLRAGQARFFWGLLLAMVCSLVVSVYVMISLGHTHGAANLHRQYFQGFATFPATIAAQKLRNPSLPNLGGWVWTAVGALVMAVLTLGLYRFPWWPLHPLGYMVSPAWIMNSLWFPFLVAWVLKSLVMKFGSMDLYRSSRMLIYGVILGQIVVAGFWLVIDVLTGTTGNRIRVY